MCRPLDGKAASVDPRGRPALALVAVAVALALAGCYGAAGNGPAADAGTGADTDTDTDADTDVDTDADTETESATEAPECGLTAFELYPGADLVGIDGTGGDDLWAVGSYIDGSGPAVQYPYVGHFDGAVWAQIASGLTEEDAGYQNDPADVWAEAPGAALVAGGVGGNGGGIGWYYPASVLRYQTSGAELLWSLTTGGYDDDAVTSLHAIWGSAPDDVYAVGDIAFDLSAGTGEMAIRYDGSGWGTVAGSACTDGGGFLYPELGAVAGSAADDVWFGGCAGAFAHFDGAAWTAEIAAPEGVGDIWRVDDLWVGGPAQALAAVIAMPSAAPFVPIPLLAWDGAAWSAVTMLPAGFGAPFLNDPTAVCEGAVAATGSDDVYASGLLFDDDPNSPLGIALAHFDGASWSLVPLDGIDLSGPPWPCINDLWISPEGAVWGVLSGGRALRYVPCDEGMGSRPITCHIRSHRVG